VRETIQHKPGDVVVHPKRPEWGDGIVKSAARAAVKGKVGQRLTVSFANNGITTINTAIVQLIPKELVQQMNNPETQSQGWLSQLEQQSSGRSGSALTELPESFSDPFSSLETRLATVLDSFRYGAKEPTPRGLLEWAISQTGANDPLSEHSRHELEQAYDVYARDRNRHLIDLIRQLKQQNKASAITVAANDKRFTPEARATLNEIMRKL